MRNNRYIKLLALLACLLLVLSACIAKPENQQLTGQDAVADSFTPATDNGDNSELGKAYKQYETLAQASGSFMLATDSDFEYEQFDGGVKITKYSGEHELLLVPDTIDGKSVIAIGKEAFAANRWLSALILPDSIKEIESLAFYGCNNLVYVNLGEGVESVGNYAFARCRSLYAIDLSNARMIGRGALADCVAINSLALSFVGGSNNENEYLGYIFGAEDIGHNAEFVPDSLRRVVLADGCKDIPDLAFYNCKYITEIVIPDSVESIGVRSVAKCRSLTSIDTGNGVKAIGDDAFFGCDNLVTVMLGNSVESMGIQAFYGCKKLKNINILNVNTIGTDAFYGCDLIAEN